MAASGIFDLLPPQTLFLSLPARPDRHASSLVLCSGQPGPKEEILPWRWLWHVMAARSMDVSSDLKKGILHHLTIYMIHIRIFKIFFLKECITKYWAKISWIETFQTRSGCGFSARRIRIWSSFVPKIYCYNLYLNSFKQGKRKIRDRLHISWIVLRIESI